MTENNATKLNVDDDDVRPQSVRLAIIGLLAVAGAGLVQGVNAASERAVFASGMEEVSKTVNREQIISLTGNLRGSLVLASSLGVAAAIVFVILAALLNRRLRWARPLTMIIGAILVVGEIVLMAADSSSIKTGNFIRDPDVPGGNLAVVETLNRTIVPSWFVPIHYLSEFFILVAAIFALVQLFRAPTAEYFHAGREQVRGEENTWSVEQVRRAEELDA